MSPLIPNHQLQVYPLLPGGLTVPTESIHFSHSLRLPFFFSFLFNSQALPFQSSLSVPVVSCYMVLPWKNQQEDPLDTYPHSQPSLPLPLLLSEAKHYLCPRSHTLATQCIPAIFCFLSYISLPQWKCAHLNFGSSTAIAPLAIPATSVEGNSITQSFRSKAVGLPAMFTPTSNLPGNPIFSILKAYPEPHHFLPLLWPLSPRHKRYLSLSFLNPLIFGKLFPRQIENRNQIDPLLCSDPPTVHSLH